MGDARPAKRGNGLERRTTASQRAGSCQYRRRGLGRRGREEFERDVVRVSERQSRPVVGIHDAAVLNSEFVEPRSPLDEFIAVRTAEGEVVQPDPAFLEPVTTRGSFVEPMQAQQDVT